MDESRIVSTPSSSPFSTMLAWLLGHAWADQRWFASVPPHSPEADAAFLSDVHLSPDGSFTSVVWHYGEDDHEEGHFDEEGDASSSSSNSTAASTAATSVCSPLATPVEPLPAEYKVCLCGAVDKHAGSTWLIPPAAFAISSYVRVLVARSSRSIAAHLVFVDSHFATGSARGGHAVGTARHRCHASPIACQGRV